MWLQGCSCKWAKVQLWPSFTRQGKRKNLKPRFVALRKKKENEHLLSRTSAGHLKSACALKWWSVVWKNVCQINHTGPFRMSVDCSGNYFVFFPIPSENTWSTHSLTANGSGQNLIKCRSAKSLFINSNARLSMPQPRQTQNTHAVTVKDTHFQKHTALQHELLGHRQLWPFQKSRSEVVS